MANPVLPELARLAMILTARQPNRDFMQAIPGGGGNERRLELQNNMMGGGGYSGVSSNPGWDALSNEEKAAFYGQNPTMAGITQLGQKAFGLSSYGMLQNALQPAFVSEQKAVAQGPMALSGFTNFGKESAIPSGGMVSPGMSGDFSPETGLQGGGSGSTGLYGDAGMPGSGYGGGADAPGANADGYGGGDAGFGGNSEAFNQGGMVDAENLMGQAPGPDDGYGALQGGEYVIKKAAVDKYGQEMLDAINNGTFQFQQSLMNFMATPRG